MRQSLVCPKCGNNHVLIISRVPDASEVGMNPQGLSIAFVNVKKAWLSDKNLERAGEVEAAVCKRCGYTELYVRDPEEIPVDGNHVREAVGPTPKEC